MREKFPSPEVAHLPICLPVCKRRRAGRRGEKERGKKQISIYRYKVSVMSVIIIYLKCTNKTQKK